MNKIYKINLEPNYIKPNLKNTSGKDIGVILDLNIENSKHDCFLSYNCPYSEIIDLTRNSNYNCLNTVIEDHDLSKILKGGAVSSIHKKKKSNRNSENLDIEDNSETLEKKKLKSIIEIKTIGNELLDLIIKKYPYIPHSVNINDSNISTLIMQLIKDKGYNLNNYEYRLIIQHLSENLFNAYKNNLNKNHSLLAAIDNKSLLNLTSKNSDCINSDDYSNISYETLVEITKAMSLKYNNISDLFIFKKSVDMKKDLVDTLLFLLSANKISGFEDLAIHQDYTLMLEQLKNNEIDKDNLFLLFLRLADKNLLPTNDISHQSLVNNENLRCSLSMLIRNVFYDVRRGTFESKSSCLLLKMLKQIKMSDVKSEEENMLHAIFAIFSFKPSLVAESKRILNSTILSDKLCLNNATLLPVFSFEFALDDIYHFTQNEIPVFSSANFSCLAYDPKTQKVMFTYSDNTDTPSNSEDILLKIYKIINTKTIETDYSNVISTITHSNQIEDFYKDVKHVKVFLTNGVFLITIPRYKKQYYCGPDKNIFFKTNIKPTLNFSPVAFEQNITVNKINYHLVGADCYDVIEHDNFINITNFQFIYDAKFKIGKFAISKAGENWIEYNPNYNITPERCSRLLKRALDSNMLFDLKQKEIQLDYFDEKSIPQELNNQTISQLLSSRPEKVFDQKIISKWLEKNGSSIKKNINNNKLSLVDMIISEVEALEKISTRAYVMIYTEDYNNYQTRIYEKIL